MSPARRSWRSIKRAYAREFPHHVVLPNAGGWRAAHTGYALAHLEALKEWRWWTAGSDVDGGLVNVWGFADLEHALWFELWATSSGIEWSVSPNVQPAPGLRDQALKLRFGCAPYARRP